MHDEPLGQSTSPDNVTLRLLLGLISFALAGFLTFQATKIIGRGPGKLILMFGAADEMWELYGRIGTGLQRADHVAFYDNGRRLAISCPRYSKLTLWDSSVTSGAAPSLLRQIDVAGRPVGLTPLGDKILVLQRPPGDDRHIKPGFYEVFDQSGERVGNPVEVGWEPDQLRIVERDGKSYALLLFSGSAEGESNRGAPSLVVASFDPVSLKFEKLSHVDFDTNGEDPLHFLPVIANDDGKPIAKALVNFGRKPGAVWVDWTDPASAKIASRHEWPEPAGEPARCFYDAGNSRVIAVPADLSRDAAIFDIDGGDPATISLAAPVRPDEVDQTADEARFFMIDQELGRISRYGTERGSLFQWPLRGPYGFGSVRLTDVAEYSDPSSSNRKVAAIDRSGGLHWLTGGWKMPVINSLPTTQKSVPNEVKSP
jgi:hypothetical protein